MNAANIYMITGPNGAGKTTSAMTLLPNLLSCEEYINADVIAAGLSPFNPDSTALQAGRLMLERIHQLAKLKKNFAFETTGASKTFAKFISSCKSNGYHVTLVFFWLHSPDLAIERIESRLKKGGHDIPADIVRRRYYRSIDNFLNIYTNLANEWLLLDNSESHPNLIARKDENNNIFITNDNAWNLIKEKRG
jgi:predicted ABC-type ATPase